MTFSTSWIKVIFIIALAFPLYSETSFSSSSNSCGRPNCSAIKTPQYPCTREKYPVCATDGHTYSNPCVFCTKKLESKGKIEFSHYGPC